MNPDDDALDPVEQEVESRLRAAAAAAASAPWELSHDEVQLRRRPISSPAWLCRPGVRRSTYSAVVAVVGDCAWSCGAVRVPPPIRESISPR